MSTRTNVATALAVLTVAATFAIATSEAQARGRGWGIGAAIVGTAIVAGVVADAYAEPAYVEGPVYVESYPRCRWLRQYNDAGFYIGRAKVCAYD